MTFQDLKAIYTNKKEVLVKIAEDMTALTNETPYLREHRNFIESAGYGFGERAFHGMWKVIFDEVKPIHTLEVGVYKGQILSLWSLIARETHLGDFKRPLGITPLSSWAGKEFPPHPDENYIMHIANLHAHFGLQFPRIIKGMSEDEDIKTIATLEAREAHSYFEIVYIDGCHDYDVVMQDIAFYSKLVGPLGVLVIDDASNYLDTPWGWFAGIDQVSRALQDSMNKGVLNDFDEVFSVIHNRVFVRNRMSQGNLLFDEVKKRVPLWT